MLNIIGRSKRDQINQQRYQTFQAHVKGGGNYDVELGCGDGRFAARLAVQTERWVLGIDRAPLSSGCYRFDQALYLAANTFVNLELAYNDLLGQRGEYSWLQEKANRIFLIMPYPSSSLTEEAALALKLLGSGGEIHVRSERLDVIPRLRSFLPGTLTEISFAPEACAISSSMTQRMVFVEQKGFRLG